MSVEELLLNDDLPGVGETPGHVHVTTHAALAWLERINPMEMYPAAAIRQAWRNSESVVSHPDARKSREVYLIYETRDNTTTILTVYPVDRSLQREGTDS